jgi:multidrug resistance efflux pump
MPRLAVIISLLLLAGSLPAGEIVRLRDVACRVRVMAAATAEESETLNNPLNQPQIVESVADGAWLNAGDPVILFDATSASNEWVRLLHQRRISDAELAAKLTDADNKIRELEDSLLAAQDKLAVENARLARLCSLPDTNDVRVAEGRLRVSALTLDAASNELARAGQRLAAGLISPAAFEKMRSAFLQAQAKADAAAEKHRLAVLPADALEVEKSRLLIANQEQELTNLVFQIEDTRAIVDLQKQGNQVRAGMLTRQIREQEEALQSVRVTAPRAGYVAYVREFVQRYMSGTDRMWRKFAFARMPKAETLVFKGVIDESQRRFFAEGDPVEIRAVGRMSEPVTGRVVSVGLLARDRAEREDSGWSGPAEYGVKAYDVVMRPQPLAPWMRLGAHAECVISSAKPIAAPSVPAEYLLNRDGQSYLMLDGRLRAVSGSTVDGWFVLNDTNLVGAAVALPPAAGERTTEARPGVRVLFETSGELVPVDTVDVVIGSIYGWQKIAWLIPEDAVVASNAVVATLDEKETRDQVVEAEQRLAEAVANSESLRQSLEVQLRQSTTLLVTGSNKLRITEIDWELARRGADPLELADARLAAEQARLTAADRRRECEAVARRSDELTSPKERSRFERAWRKVALQAESAALNLAEIEAGPDPLEVERKRAAAAEARLNYDAIRATAQADEFAARVELLKAERAESFARRRLDRANDWRQNLSLHAPRAGIVRYKRVWSGSGFSKAAAGYMVSSGFSPVLVADMSRMEIRAEVPERFYPLVREGMPVKIQISAVSDVFFDGSVGKIEYLFEEKRPKDVERGLYSGRETLGETVFYVRVVVTPPPGLSFKAGAVARVVFPTAAAAAEVRP